MDQIKTGQLIRELRREKNMTQQQLADRLNVSDKAVSKWECGQGLPDVSLLKDLSQILGVNAEKILAGDLPSSEVMGGNMRNIKFYICPECGNVTFATKDEDVSCCGRRLTALEAQPSDSVHKLNLQEVEDEYYITFDHEMKKSHYLNFIAWVGIDRVMLVQLYPEQGAELRMPMFRKGRFYFGCSSHGLFICDKM